MAWYGNDMDMSKTGWLVYLRGLQERNELSRTEFRQGAGALFLPFLLGDPHVFLVRDLSRNWSVSSYVCYGGLNRLIEQLTRLARTAPPKNTICLRRGGSSMRTLNFCLMKGRSVRKVRYREREGIGRRWNTYVQSFRVPSQRPCKPQLLQLLL